jgi:hypothetical protein
MSPLQHWPDARETDDNEFIVADTRTWRAAGPKSGTKNAEDIERERRAFRELIDKFRRDRATEDDGDFYRNVGRYIFRSMVVHGPRNRGH